MATLPFNKETYMTQATREHVTYAELYKAYIDCRLTKRCTSNALEFEIKDNMLLYRLWLGLNNGSYVIGKSITFCVDKPVKREIFAADFRDRIVHHLLINRINRYFEDEFIEDNYSCRKGKGTSYCVERCEAIIREASQNYTVPTWIVKCDLKAYFMSIDKRRLFDRLVAFLAERECPDLEFTLALLRQVVFHRPQEHYIRRQPLKCWNGLPQDKSLFGIEGDKGLPIGNLTSQILASFHLNSFDHWIKETLGVEHYGRYVDDFFFLCHSTKEASRIIKKCRAYLKREGITLHPKKIYIQEVRKGIKMAGAVIKPHRTYVSNRTKGNFYDAVRLWGEWLDKVLANGGQPTREQVRCFVSSINSYLGFMKNYKTYNIRRKVLSSDWMKHWYKYCYVSGDFTKVTMRKEQRIWMGGTETLRLAA